MSSIIRKSILTGINNADKKEKRISDQVEPLIKKMLRTTTTKKKIMGNNSKGRIIVEKEESIPFKDAVSDKLRRVNLSTVKTRISGGKNQMNGKTPTESRY